MNQRARLPANIHITDEDRAHVVPALIAVAGERASLCFVEFFTANISNHSFGATGITAYLKNSGTLEKAAQLANNARTRTTQFHDRRREELSFDEAERIGV